MNTVVLSTLNVYLDTTWSPPPPIVYLPVGSTQNLSVTIYRVSTSQPNTGPTAFSFYNDANNQYLYLPYTTTSNDPVTPGTTITQAYILTKGVSSSIVPKLDATPLFYTTYSIYPNPPLTPILNFRASTLAPGSSALPSGSNDIFGAGVIDYLDPSGAQVVFALKDSAGSTFASYVWRKIDPNFVSGTECSPGYASGPEDLFLQQSF
ncbi:MAG: hypothetical protein NVSMB14_00180 [Isosphaeraceae bacterium]